MKYLFFILFTSCSLFYEPIIPSEVEPYVDQFIYEGAKRGVHVNKDRMKIKFEDLGSRVGSAYYYRPRYFVKLNPKNWAVYNEDQRCYLVFHELGHAVLKRRHDDTMIDGRYASIMAAGRIHHTVHPQSNYFRNYYDEYMLEMFSK
jgi:hypothetical protein